MTAWSDFHVHITGSRNGATGVFGCAFCDYSINLGYLGIMPGSAVIYDGTRAMLEHAIERHVDEMQGECGDPSRADYCRRVEVHYLEALFTQPTRGQAAEG